MVRRSFVILLALAASASVARAGDVLGEWSRDDGKGKVRFTSCGDAVCGAISWLKDTGGPGKVGQRVFFDMKPAGDNAWAGTAFNPEAARNIRAR